MARKTDWPDGRGGYPAGDKLVSDLGPPPSGPGAGAKPKPSSASEDDPVREPERDGGGPERS
jgi:hypothetical protein